MIKNSFTCNYGELTVIFFIYCITICGCYIVSKPFQNTLWMLENGDVTGCIVFCAYSLCIYRISNQKIKPLICIVMIGLGLSQVWSIAALIMHPNLANESTMPIIHTTSESRSIFGITFEWIYTICIFTAIYIGLEISTFSKCLKKKSNTVYSSSIILKGGLILAFLNLILTVVYGIGRAGDQSSQIGFVARFFPIEPILYVAISAILLGHKKHSSLYKYGFLTCLLFIIAEMAKGSRGGFLYAIFVFVFSSMLYNFKQRIKLTKTIAVIVAILLILPLALTYVSVIKSTIHGKYENSVEYVNFNAIQSKLQQGGHFEKIFHWITARFWGYQVLEACMNENFNTGLYNYTNFRYLLISTYTQILPNQFFNLQDVDPLGKVFGVYFQNHTWEVKHSGAFFGVPFTYLFFGWYGIILLTVLFYFIGTVYINMNRSNFLELGLTIYSLQVFIFAYFVTGNMDNVVSRYLTNIFVYLIYYQLSKIINTSNINILNR